MILQFATTLYLKYWAILLFHGVLMSFEYYAAIATVVSVAEILKNSGHAVEKSKKYNFFWGELI